MAMSLSLKTEEALRCRVFIGNLPSDNVTRESLCQIFSQYGSFVDCSIYKNYGFVQFNDEKSALAAVAGTNRTMMFDRRLDVKIATSGRKDASEGGVQKAGLKKRKQSFNPNEVKPLMSQHPLDPHAAYPMFPPPIPPAPTQAPGFNNFYLPQSHTPMYPHQPPRMPVLNPGVPQSPANRLQQNGQTNQPSDASQDKRFCDIICISKKLHSYAEFVGYTIERLGFSYNINILYVNYPVESLMKRISHSDVTCAILLKEENSIHRSINLHIFGSVPEVAEELLETRYCPNKTTQPVVSQGATTKSHTYPNQPPSNPEPSNIQTNASKNSAYPPTSAPSSGVSNPGYHDPYSQQYYMGYAPTGSEAPNTYYNMSNAFSGAHPSNSYPPPVPAYPFDGATYKRHPV